MSITINKDKLLGKVDAAAVQQYCDLVDQFIAKNSHNNDILSVVLEYNDLLIKLSLLYSSYPGKFGSMPELNAKHDQLVNFKHDLTDELMSAVSSDYFGMTALKEPPENLMGVIEKQGASYTLPAIFKGINAYMLTAVRYCEAKADVAEKLRDSLAKIDILKSAGADINAKDEFGRTALFYVVIGPMMLGLPQHPGREQIVRKLLAQGANPNLKDVKGNRALEYFMLEHYPSKDSIELLRKNMDNVTVTDIKPNAFVAETNRSKLTQIINIISYPFLAGANLAKLIASSFSNK